MSRLFLGNLDYALDDAALELFVRKSGIEARNVRIVCDAGTGRSQGFGFVELGESQDIEKAISVLDRKDLNGRPLRVLRAASRSTLHCW